MFENVNKISFFCNTNSFSSPFGNRIPPLPNRIIRPNRPFNLFDLGRQLGVSSRPQPNYSQSSQVSETHSAPTVNTNKKNDIKSKIKSRAPTPGPGITTNSQDNEKNTIRKSTRNIPRINYDTDRFRNNSSSSSNSSSSGNSSIVDFKKSNLKRKREENEEVNKSNKAQKLNTYETR